MEQRTNQVLSAKLGAEQAPAVALVAIEILRRSHLLIKAIIFDNKLEFVYHESIVRQLRAGIYFAYSYHG